MSKIQQNSHESENEEEYEFDESSDSVDVSKDNLNKQEGQKDSKISHVETVIGEQEEKVDIRDLGNVASFQTIAYHLYAFGTDSTVLRAMGEVMKEYSSFTDKAMNIRQLDLLLSQVRAMEDAHVTKEEAMALKEQSFSISNSLAQKIKVFISKRGAKFAIVDIKTGVIVHTDSDELSRFMSTSIMVEHEDRFPIEYLTNWVSVTRTWAERHNMKEGLSIALKIKHSAFPLNQFILSGQIEKILEEAKVVASNLSPTGKKGLTTKNHFSTKVVSAESKNVMVTLSPQIMSLIREDFEGSEDRGLTQIEYDVDVQTISTFSRDVRSWSVASDGPGDMAHFSPETKVIVQEEDVAPETDPGLLKLLRKVAAKGNVLTKKELFVKTQWSTKLSNSSLSKINTVGFVHHSVFATLYARRDKNKTFEGVDPSKVLKGHVFLLLDPISFLILAIPKRMLKLESDLRTRDPGIGIVVTKGLLKVISLYGSIFMLGLLGSPDWNDLDPLRIFEAKESFRRASASIKDERFMKYCVAMCTTLNFLDPMIRIRAGSKSDSDKDVADYFEDQDWELIEEDEEYHEKLVQEEFDF